MSLSSISSQLPHTVEQNQNIERRTQAHQDGCSTTLKVTAVFASFILSIGALVLGGPVTGLVVALICGVGLLALFNSYNPFNGIRFMHHYVPPGASHNHPGRGQVPPGGQNPYVPGHVVVGAGHFPPAQPPGAHVGVGQGHFQPGQPPGAHVGVGQGHLQPGQPPRAAAPIPGQGNVGVGRGHNHGPTQAPPPGGPGGHVPVGRR